MKKLVQLFGKITNRFSDSSSDSDSGSSGSSCSDTDDRLIFEIDTTTTTTTTSTTESTTTMTTTTTTTSTTESTTTMTTTTSTTTSTSSTTTTTSTTESTTTTTTTTTSSTTTTTSTTTTPTTINPNTPPTIATDSTRERDRRTEPPTARSSIGKRFLALIPSSDHIFPSILSNLVQFADDSRPPLDKRIITMFNDKYEDYCETDSNDKALALSILWLYTTNSWVYLHVNTYLREDSSLMKHIASYIKGLLWSSTVLNDDQWHYSGRVYRRCKLTEVGAEFYQTDKIFLWSSFTSTTIDFLRDVTANQLFGNTLFVIDIPERLKQHTVSLERVSAFPQEREVLLLPNMAFQVREVRREVVESEFEGMKNVFFLNAVYAIILAF